MVSFQRAQWFKRRVTENYMKNFLQIGRLTLRHCRLEIDFEALNHSALLTVMLTKLNQLGG